MPAPSSTDASQASPCWTRALEQVVDLGGAGGAALDDEHLVVATEELAPEVVPDLAAAGDDDVHGSGRVPSRGSMARIASAPALVGL